MSLTHRIGELRAATGGPRALARKTRDLARSLRTLLDRQERQRRIGRLQSMGLAGEQPSDWQLALAAHHMLFDFLLPSNIEFYEHYGRNHTWAQVLRVLDEPSAMADPIGLGIDRAMLVSHLVQVVHTSAGYDVALLLMFEDGLSDLRAQLEQLVAGTHPRQAGIDAIVERADYHSALLAALDRFEDDPIQNWKVSTVEAPDDCRQRFDWGIETFGTPGRLLTYARTLPQTPSQSLRAWWGGTLRVPSPAG